MMGGLGDVLAGRDRWSVLLGDSRGALEGLIDGSVDHIITDPPYDAKTHAGALTEASSLHVAGGEANRITFAPLPSPEELSSTFCRVAKRWSIAFCALEQLGAYRDGAGAAWVRAGVWDRINPAPQVSGDRPAQACDGVAILHRKGKKRWNDGGRAAIWRHSVEHGQKVHPTQKPLALLLQMVEQFTDVGDLVMDPFMGSGTTGIACLRLGRRFLGWELDPQHFATALDRLEAEAKGSTLSAMRRGQGSIFDLDGVGR